MKHLVPWGCSIMALSLVASCGAPTEDIATSDYGDAPPMGDRGAGGMDEGSVGEVSGDVWARRQVMVGIAETPVGPTLNRVTTILRTALRETEEGFVSEEETCHTRIERPELDIIGSEIPPGFIASMAIIDRVFRRDQGRVSFARSVEVHGARLRNIDGDDLPETIDDSRVFDQDLDGKPGMTVLITGLIQGEMHLVQRTTTRLEGTEEGDRMAGLLEWRSEEHILEASDPLLAMPVNLTPHADETLSHFEAVRVAPEQTCADLIANEAMLFEP